MLAAFLIGFTISQMNPKTPNTEVLNSKDIEKEDVDAKREEGITHYVETRPNTSLTNINNGVATEASNAAKQEERSQVDLAMQGQGQPNHVVSQQQPNRANPNPNCANTHVTERCGAAEVGGQSQHNNGPAMDAVTTDDLELVAVNRGATRNPPRAVSPNTRKGQGRVTAQTQGGKGAIDPSPDPNPVVQAKPPEPLCEESCIEELPKRSVSPNTRKGQGRVTVQAEGGKGASDLASRANPVVA